MGENAAGEITDGIYSCNGDEQMGIFRFTVLKNHAENLVKVICPVKVEQCQGGIFPNICQAVMQGIIIVSVPRREG
jgi:hypothetical protein